MYVKLNGDMVYLWRAVDHESEILESFITRIRDKAAALTFMKKALKLHGSPDAVTTDGLRSDGAAMRELGDEEKRDVGRWANNRVENSHLSFRRRERAMLRFRRMKTLQKFASVHANIHNRFNLERHLIDRQTYRGTTLRRLGGVAGSCEIGRCAQSPDCIIWRAVRVRLTAPLAALNGVPRR
jgi:putative transposase